MQDFRMEMVSADEVYVTCVDRISTVVIADENADLYDIAEGYRKQRFTESAESLVLLQSVERNTSNRVAVSLNLDIGLIDAPAVLFNAEAWWVVRVSEDILLAKPAKDDDRGSVSAEVDAEFYAVLRKHGRIK